MGTNPETTQRGKMKTKKVKISELTPDDINANKGTARGSAMLEKSLREYGAGRSVLVDKAGRIIAGNKTIEAAGSIGLDNALMIETDGSQVVIVKRTDLDLDSPQGRGLAIADNRVAEVGLDWDMEALEKIGEELDLGEFWFDDELPEIDFSSIDEDEDDEPTGDADAVPEVEDMPTSKRGDLWILGDHRVLCGDSTNADDVARLMNGERAQLLHADPPYGMGKEGEGVANDNLYREKLDAFQMQWWAAFRPHLKENASAYIWGNAEDLWRLWYLGGLGSQDQVHFRTEIVWDKGNGMGMNSEMHHMFATTTERCLFLMLGHQFLGNQNKEDFFEGYRPLLNWLQHERDKCGLSNSDINKITGTHMAGHWFTESQFAIISKDRYEQIQASVNGNGFCESYDDLLNKVFPGVRSQGNAHVRTLAERMRDKRSYFNNTHDIMGDVWQFPRVQGEDRHGHATPKPVDMMRRVMKSSAESGGLVVEPFGGSGATLAGAEATGRRCFTMELLPQWVDVIVKRWQDYTGKEATHEDGRTFAQVAEERASNEAQETEKQTD